MKIFIMLTVMLGIIAVFFVSFVGMDKISETFNSLTNEAKDNLSNTNTEETATSPTSQPPVSSTIPSPDSVPSPEDSIVDLPETKPVTSEKIQLSWVTSILHGAGGRFGEIAIDSNDKVHIAHFGHDYSAYSNPKTVLIHTTNAPGSWVNEIVEPIGIAESISIVIDTDDGIHISYYATDGLYDLRYAYKATNASLG
ncbi:hypothetical protein ACFLVZ_03625 [Chloroflexota bacterium]